MQQQSVIPLIKGDKVSADTDYRDALAVNMYAVAKPILGAAGYMLCYPGLTQIAAGQGADRGANYNERFETHFRVSGGSLISVNPGGQVTVLGGIPGTSQVSMPYSFNTQAVIADGKMFLYSPTNGFSQVTDEDLKTPLDGVFIDGYYFMTDGENLFHTELNNESSIDPNMYGTTTFMPDPILGVGKTQDSKVIIFGRFSIEFFANIATEDFAFTRIETRAQKIGIVATHAKTECIGSWFFVGSRKEESLGVYLLGVGQSTKVSSREVDKILATYTEPELSDIRMESRVEDDGTFVIVHLPNETLMLNVNLIQQFGKEAVWSILKTGVGGDNYRGINGVFDAKRGYWCYGDKLDGRIGKLDNTVFTQYGLAQEWYLYTPMFDLTTKSLDEIELETIPGNNVNADATVAFSITRDGQTWSQEWWELYSLPLDYSKKFIMRRLGYVDAWIAFRFRGLTTSRMSFALCKVTHG